jgi:hypothetical protein
MGKLMVAVTRFLSLCAVLLLAMLFLGIEILPAQAKLGPISIESVYTTAAASYGPVRTTRSC